MKPKRSLGQHFLKSESVLDAILEIANVSKDDSILEIGPGKGALTKKLLSAGARVIAIEKDDRLTSFDADNPKLRWIHGDILNFDLSSLPPVKVVANIPYYLSSLIMEMLLARISHKIYRKDGTSAHTILSITLLVQKEFAEKIVRLGSFLSLYAHLYFEPKIIQEVSPSDFNPPPKVTSAILHLKAKPIDKEIDPDRFIQFAKLISGGKRKTLKSLCPTIPLEKLHLPSTVRLGELTFEKLLFLYKNLPENMSKIPTKSSHK